MKRINCRTPLRWPRLPAGVISIAMLLALCSCAQQDIEAPVSSPLSEESDAPASAPPSQESEAPVATPASPENPPWMGDKLTTETIQAHHGKPGVIRLRWTTQSEENSFGFFVRRGDNADGTDFAILNEDEIIASAGNSSTERKYAYYDKTVKIGEKHYYYLEEVDLAGNVAKFSPIFPAVAKFPYHAELDPDAPEPPVEEETVEDVY